MFKPRTVLIEDKASGTQLIQELTNEEVYGVQRYAPTMEKIMRMHTATGLIENGFVHIPDKAKWLPEYLHELSTFDKGRFDDQVDSTSQALDWFKGGFHQYGALEFMKLEMKLETDVRPTLDSRRGQPCTECNIGALTQRIGNFLKCYHCGAQWTPPSVQLDRGPTRADVLRSNPRLGR